MSKQITAPKPNYARSDDASIAYQVLGEGPQDLVIVPPFVSHIELSWEHPPYERFMDQIAEFARVIVFDKRGSGLSDPLTGSESLEQRADDIIAVMEAAGSEQATLFGISEGVPMSALVAAMYPNMVERLIFFGGFPRAIAGEDYPDGLDPAVWEDFVERICVGWGEGVSLEAVAPSKVTDDDQPFRDWWGRFERESASPRVAHDALALDAEIDIRAVLPTIQAPTLILHRIDDTIPIAGSRYLAEHIPEARLVELEGDAHWPWLGDTDAIVDETEEFMTGVRPTREPDRVLATVLFTDIVDSTKQVVEFGDGPWKEVLARHDQVTRREIERYHGREVNTTGDGFVATFDGPARAIHCARAITDVVGPLGIEVRAGLHTGECEVRSNGDIAGIAVHMGARVSAKAGAGEVLVSSTVKDLVAGSGIEFADRGTYELKGVPGQWGLFAVEAS